MDSFLDTNISLAYVFSIEPKNTNAKKIFKLYDKYFWSKNVRQEFEHRFDHFKKHEWLILKVKILLCLMNHDVNTTNTARRLVNPIMV